MNFRIKPVEFVSALSEAEIRMTLRDLCGSRLDNYPFSGEIEQNSFSLIKNPIGIIGHSRGVPEPILKGEFFEQGEKTFVSISLKERISDIIGRIILALVFLIFAVFCFVSMIDKGIIPAVAVAVTVLSVGAALVALDCLILFVRFRSFASKIKKVLS